MGASSPVAEAAALGLSALAGVVAGVQDGITIVDSDRRFVYANPAACEMLGSTLEQLRGQDFVDSLPTRERAFVLGRFSERRGRSLGDSADPFTGILRGSDGAEREVVCSTFPMEIAGVQHGVTIFRDVTGPRTAARTAAALAQTAAQLVGSASVERILDVIARHAVIGTRAVACGIAVAGEDTHLAESGEYGLPKPASKAEWMASLLTLADLPQGALLLANKPVVLPDCRSEWETNPRTARFAAALTGLEWQCGVSVALSWQDHVFGFLGVFLPTGLSGPNEAELAFYSALADQAAVAVTSARLASQAAQAAAVLERTRLARELHDSVSQALFSMTMHARAAQLAMVKAGLDESGPLGRSIAELGGLTRGAMAEMRALIFELRPGALAEEGLLAALRKQGAALTARERVVITVEGPERRLEFPAGAEEHLYRIVSEALHNVVKHARADTATVRITAQTGILRVEVHDDGAGFDQDAEHPGHLGLSTMAERAAAIGASLDLSSAPGAGTTVAVSLPHDRPDEGWEGWGAD